METLLPIELFQTDLSNISHEGRQYECAYEGFLGVGLTANEMQAAVQKQ